MHQVAAPDPSSDEVPTEDTVPAWKTLYVGAVIVGAAAFCLGPSLLGFRTLIAVNSLTGYFPWMALHGNMTAGHQVCTSDTIDSVMPGIAAARHQLFSGHIPDWQGLVAGGSPLASVPDLGLLDPLSLPYFVMPLWLAPAFVMLLSWVVGLGGSFLWLRRLRVTRPSALLAGLIFVTSGFMVMWANWPQTRTAALVPALFWALERLVQRRRITDAALLALVVASLIFGGFPQVTGYAVYLGIGYLVVRLIVLHRTHLRSWVHTVVLGAGALVVGGLVTAVQLLPFLSFYSTTNLGYRTGNDRVGLPFSGLLTLFSPNADGLCIVGTLTHGRESPVEQVAYVGAAALVLAVAGAAWGFAKRRNVTLGVRGHLFAALVFITLLGWMSPTLRDHVVALPIFNGTFIGRIRVLQGFVIAGLAAIGFDWFVLGPRAAELLPAADEGQRRRPTWPRLWATAVWLAAGIFAAVLLYQSRRFASKGGYEHAVVLATWIPAVLLAVSLLLVAAGRMRGRWLRHLAFVVLPVLVAAQGAQFFHTVLPGDSPKDFYPVAPSQTFLAAHIGNSSYTSSEETMYPATALYYGLRTPTGHSFTEAQWIKLLQKVDPLVMKSATFSMFDAKINSTTAGHQPILDALGVKYYVATPYDLDGIDQPLPVSTGTVQQTGSSLGCSLPGRPMRGIVVGLAGTLTPKSTSAGVTVEITVHDEGHVATGGIFSTQPESGSLRIPVAGEELPAGGTAHVVIRAVGSNRPMSLLAAGTSAACAVITPSDDGLKEVYADPGSVVYQRMGALPSIRWASRTTVLGTETARVDALAAGVPADEVVLAAPAPAASGAPAQVSTGTDSGTTISAEVTARGAGYLVVADALLQPGWSATLDGRSTPILAADEALGAVRVPPGSHSVIFRYRAPHQVVGAAMSGVSLLVLLALAGWDWRRHRRLDGGLRQAGSGSPKLTDP